VGGLYADQSIAAEDEGQSAEALDDLVRKLSEDPGE
jgi:hypothetical protein